MIVITLTDCPPSLRGDLTKWLQEVNTGVYVGNVNARVRDELWDRVIENAKKGRATLVYSSSNEQQLDFRVHNTIWEPIDFDGLKLMLRPSPARIQKLSELRMGFSKSSKMRKAKQMAKRKQLSKYKSHPQTYIVIDVETTGLSIVDDEIIEVGALLINKGIIETKYESLVRSNKKIPSSIQSLTGITNSLLEQNGRDLSIVLPEFLAFVSEYPIVSHNADFDYGFIRASFKRYNLPLLSNRCIDTLKIARRKVDDIKNYKLSTLLDYFKIEIKGSHRSMDDCLTTYHLYNKLIKFEQNEN